MPFTALNQDVPVTTTPVFIPGWIKEDLSELPTDVMDSLVALWSGEARAFNKDTTQKVISELRNLVVDLKGKIRAQPSGETFSRAESPSKKRGLEDAELANGHPEKKLRVPISQSSVSGSWKGTRFEGVSFTIPQRKKLSLTVSSARNEGLLVTPAGTNTPEFGIPWSQVEHVICLPVPEKTQAQKSFVVFPKNVDGLTENPNANYETIVWTVPDTKAKGAAEDEPTQAQAIKTALETALPVLEPNPKDFTSEIPPTGAKKGEKAYHIKAFKGSKDGFLFLLPHGIIWAFKKPLIFFSFAAIDSISYTSVLQRTFNLVISARSSPSPSTTSTSVSAIADDPAPLDYEFSMLDQADFGGIDAYVKTHGLQDASLAEQRRAKVYNVNGKKGDGAAAADDAAEGGGGDEDGEGGSELQRAAVAANAAAESSDDEDEDENFDPGSDGESFGSGSGSEDDEDDGDGDSGGNKGGGGRVGRKGADLVRDELGSEAEDVELSSEDEEGDGEDEDDDED